MKYLEWTLIKWKGNPLFNYKCWVKSFDRGCVYVGDGDFLTIIYSFGASSDKSHSSTRWRKDKVLTEKEAMEMIDLQYNK